VNQLPLFAVVPPTVADLGAVCMWAVPALGEGGRDAELVEHARDNVVDQVVHGLRMVVEGRQSAAA